ncbi:Shedu immune nuclease family protein [Acidovorax sp. SRB_14]|uniref:Shedu immune nuclease family protein n=1 Tax=Acidovorax sp. SRB_14 TaxID=1962699 RepID=UPI00156661FB|nr:Shedu immune nuclease family protein [Acidovorax sp. SRB_14]
MQENDEKLGKPKDSEDDFLGAVDEHAGEEKSTDGLEPGANPDAEAMLVSLKKSTYGLENCVEVYAHGEAFPDGGTEKVQQNILLARVTEGALTMFPLVSASYRPMFLSPKYGKLTTITVLAEEDEPWWLPETIRDFDGLLESLPTGFGRHAKYGLGLKWEYRLIPYAILEMHGITELVFESGNGASTELPKFKLGIDRFSAIKRSIDSITTRSRARSLRERQLLAFNELLHVADPALYERRFAKVKPGEIYELVKLGGRVQNRSADDRLAAAKIIRDDADKMAAEQPSHLMELRAVIEQVTLTELIAKIEGMLSKNLPEPKWQAFFKANPFVLGLAFPHPVILIQDQAHVGGTMLRGAGESIVDFLFAQRFTGSLALIEIKRPSTKLIEAKTFRGDLHAPHKDLTSAMAQVLDQRFQLLNNFAAKSHDPALKDTHVSAVHCIVIAGTAPGTIQEKRSLDLFRHSSRDVVVVTFDELLDKLREILRLMTAGSAHPASLPEVEPSTDNSDRF